MDIAIVNVVIGLLIFMGVNVILGSVDSVFSGTFDLKKCLKGVAKAIVIVVCYAGVYYAGTLNQDIVVLKLNKVDVNIVTAIYMTSVVGFIAYGKQIIEKLNKFVTPK